MKKNKFLSNFTKWVVVPALILTMLPYPLKVEAKTKAKNKTQTGITRVSELPADGYSSSQSIAINGTTVYCLRASASEQYKGDGNSCVGLYVGKIQNGKIKNKIKMKHKFSGGMLGHANDCTYYNNQLFVAPRGCPEENNRNYFGYVYKNNKKNAYRIVSIKLSGENKYSVKGYKLEEKTRAGLTVNETGLTKKQKSTVSGITYAGTYKKNGKNYPKFVLKNDYKIVSTYLKGSTFCYINSFTVEKPKLEGHSLVWQGITYHKGYLYFGLGAKVIGSNLSTYDYTYIARKQFKSMKNGGTYNLDSYLVEEMPNRYSSFETEGVAFDSKGIVYFIVNGKEAQRGRNVLKGKKLQKDAIYRSKKSV